MSPQQKKKLSYARDRRNAYRENSKASRKNLPRRRARKHRQFRHAVKQTIAEARDLDAVESRVAAVRRDGWQKVSDIPLAEYVRRQRERRVRTGQQPL